MGATSDSVLEGVLPDGETRVPVLFAKCLATYKLLASEPKNTAIEIEGEPFPLWSGHLTHFLDEELGFGMPEYSRIMRTLRDMGCVVQVRRGNAYVKAQWALVAEPTIEGFTHKTQQKRGNELSKTDKYILAIERKMATRHDEFMDMFDERLRRIEAQLGIESPKMERESNNGETE